MCKIENKDQIEIAPRIGINEINNNDLKNRFFKEDN